MSGWEIDDAPAGRFLRVIDKAEGVKRVTGTIIKIPLDSIRKLFKTIFRR
jgi:hypothetical protein